MSVLVVSDSFASPGDGLTKWPDLLAASLGRPVVNHANPGSGYNNIGLNWPARYSRQLIAAPRPQSVELVIFAGSVNDRWSDKQLLRLWATQTFLLARQLYPGAKQLVVGAQWSGPDAMPAEIPQVRDAYNDAMWAYDWDYPYIDPVPANAADWWFPPNRPDLWGPDRFHPNQAGQQRIHDKTLPHVRALMPGW